MWSTWAEKQKCMESRRVSLSVEQISLHKICTLHFAQRSAIWNCWRVLLMISCAVTRQMEDMPQMRAVFHVRERCFWNNFNVFSANLKIYAPYYKRRRETLWHLNSAGHLSASELQRNWTTECLFLRAYRNHCCLHRRWLFRNTNGAVIWITSRNVCGVTKRSERQHYISWKIVTQGKRFWKISELLQNDPLFNTTKRAFITALLIWNLWSCLNYLLKKYLVIT